MQPRLVGYKLLIQTGSDIDLSLRLHYSNFNFCIPPRIVVLRIFATYDSSSFRTIYNTHKSVCCGVLFCHHFCCPVTGITVVRVFYRTLGSWGARALFCETRHRLVGWLHFNPTVSDIFPSLGCGVVEPSLSHLSLQSLSERPTTWNVVTYPTRCLKHSRLCVWVAICYYGGWGDLKSTKSHVLFCSYIFLLNDPWLARCVSVFCLSLSHYV